MGFGTNTKVQTPSVDESHRRSGIKEAEHSEARKTNLTAMKEVIVAGTKEKLIIAVVIVAGIALLAVDGITGQSDCESGRYDQTIGGCVDGKD